MIPIEELKDSTKDVIQVLMLMKVNIALTALNCNGKLSGDEMVLYIKTFNDITILLKNWLEISTPGVSNSDNSNPAPGGTGRASKVQVAPFNIDKIRLKYIEFLVYDGVDFDEAVRIESDMSMTKIICDLKEHGII